MRDEIGKYGMILAMIGTTVILFSYLSMMIVESKLDVALYSYIGKDGKEYRVTGREIDVADISIGDSILYFNSPENRTENIVTDIEYNNEPNGYIIKFSDEQTFFNNSSTIVRTNGLDREKSIINRIKTIGLIIGGILGFGGCAIGFVNCNDV